MKRGCRPYKLISRSATLAIEKYMEDLFHIQLQVRCEIV